MPDLPFPRLNDAAGLEAFIRGAILQVSLELVFDESNS